MQSVCNINRHLARLRKHGLRKRFFLFVGLLVAAPTLPACKGFHAALIYTFSVMTPAVSTVASV